MGFHEKTTQNLEYDLFSKITRYLIKSEKEEKDALEIIQSLIIFFKKGGKRRVVKSENNLEKWQGKKARRCFSYF